MNTANRTHRTIQNSRISLLLFLFQIFIGFYSRKIFLDHLGAEVLGVNTTLGNILSFLNLTELGIGIAMATSLYKPISNQDQEGICEILTVQGILYKRIAIILCCLSIPILIAMPWIFPSVECGIGYGDFVCRKCRCGAFHSFSGIPFGVFTAVHSLCCGHRVREEGAWL